MIQHITTINSSKVAFFVQKGEGIPIVFLHGFCEDSSVWNDFLLGFSNEFLVNVDLPGFGKSDPQKNCSVSDMAKVINTVLEEINIKKCVLIGHSMGGYVALEFAKSFSEKLVGLGLFHSQPFADSIEKKENRQKGIEFVQKNGSIYFVKQLIPNLFAPRFGSNNSLTISKLTLIASKYSEDGIINGLAAMMQRADNQEVLKKITIPVLFIIGEEDIAIPKENSYSQLVLPAISDIHLLKGVGHMGMFEAKSECVSIVKNFIGFVNQS